MNKTSHNISNEDRLRVVLKAEQGISHRQIAREMNINRKSVDRIVKKHQETGSVKDRERSGRPKLSTIRDDRALVRTSLSDRQLTAPQLRTHWFLSTGVASSVTTVKSRLSEAGLRGCIAVKKPLLRLQNRHARLDFARQHQHWSTNDWEKVLWSDESSFEVFNSAKRVFVRRRTNERYSRNCVVPTVKGGGGKLMIWGCMSAAGVGLVCRVEGTVNAPKYIQILENYMLPSAAATFDRQEWHFQQDNAPCHKAKAVMTWLETNGVEAVSWPPQSPDLNPIEHLWELLFNQIKGKKPQNASNLFEMLEQGWNSIGIDVCRNLVHSMPKRISAVIKVRGGYTKY